MKCLAVIPARYSSQRLPGKPLADIAGKSLIQRVYERALEAKTITKLLIATDDQRIFDAAQSFSANVVMTSADHQSGSDRAAEVLTSEEAAGNHYDLVANIQGDMPFINPVIIDSVIQGLASAAATTGLGTLAVPFENRTQFEHDSAVKVVLDNTSRALYFSRCQIPYGHKQLADNESPGLKHVGLYVYRAEILKQFTKLPPAPLEQREKLEQLRALYYGIGIHVAVVPGSLMYPSIEVDTQADLDAARAYCLNQKSC